MSTISGLTVGVLLAALCAVAESAEIVYQFAGTVTAIDDQSFRTPHPFPTVQVGDPWSATLRISDATADAAASPDVGVYYGACGSVVLLGLAMDMSSPHQRCARVAIYPNAPELLTFDASPDTPGPFLDANWYMQVFSIGLTNTGAGNQIRFDTLDQSFVSLVDFAGTTMNMSFARYNFDCCGVGMSGNVTSFSAQVVPLPAGAWLLGSAVGLLTVLGRRTLA